MLYSLGRSLAAVFLFAQIQLITAQCDYCDGIFFNDAGDCGVDPNDGSDLAFTIQICPCAVQTLIQSVTLTETNGATVTTASTVVLANTQSTQAVTFTYDIANTAIQSGSPVTLLPDSPQDEYPSYSFIYSPVTSIFTSTETATYYDSTSTVQTTSTSTATAGAMTSISQATSFTPCTTGTSTVTAKAKTVVSTSTITRKPLTVTIPKLAHTTTTLTCLGPASAQSKRKRDELRARQYNAGTFEEPYCPDVFGPPASTTYTNTVVVTTETTTTNTNVALTVTTSTTTILPTPLTTTVCSNVLGTVTSTPTKTSTVFSVAKRSTIFTTSTYTITNTVVPKGLHKCSTSVAPHGPLTVTCVPKSQ